MCILKCVTYTIFLVQKCSRVINIAVVLIAAFNLLCQWVFCIFWLNGNIFFQTTFFTLCVESLFL